MTRSSQPSSWVEAALGIGRQPDAPSPGGLKDQAYRSTWEKIRALPAGAEVEYHAGFAGSLAEVRAADPALDGRAEAFSQAAGSGQGMVYQRRTANSLWSYRFRKLRDG